jgi:hypothetical protein
MQNHNSIYSCNLHIVYLILFFLGYSDSRKRKHKSKQEKLWEDNPELYGIRRSNRPRVDPKPPKLESQVGHKRKLSKKHGAGKVKRRKFSTGDDSSDEENSRFDFMNFLHGFLYATSQTFFCFLVIFLETFDKEMPLLVIKKQKVKMMAISYLIMVNQTILKIGN